MCLQSDFLRVEVLVEKKGSSWINDDKPLIYFYLLCFIDLLYFIMVLPGSKAIIRNFLKLSPYFVNDKA